MKQLEDFFSFLHACCLSVKLHFTARFRIVSKKDKGEVWYSAQARDGWKWKYIVKLTSSDIVRLSTNSSLWHKTKDEAIKLLNEFKSKIIIEKQKPDYHYEYLPE